MSLHATQSLPLVTLLLRYLPIVFLRPHAPSLPTNASVLPIILTTRRTKTHGLTYTCKKKVLCCICKMSSTRNNMSRVAPSGHILTETPQLFPKFTLVQHTKALNALAISPSGSILLSGGKQFHFQHDSSDTVQSGNDSCIVIWSLSSDEMIQEVHVPSAGFISCLKWIGLSNQEDMFVFGASDGNIHLCRQCKDQPLFSFCSITLAYGGAIKSFTWDSVCSRLASVGNGEVKLWNISSEASMF